MKSKIKYACVAHPDRVAVVDRNGQLLCWQCCLDPETFAKRFGENFYKEQS
ncbi:MAG: hypothetical protein WC551_11255 [Patescibacteria group bacterium]